MYYPAGKIDESAFLQGAQVGASGEAVSVCPYSERSIKGKSWREGYRQGRDYFEALHGSSLHVVGQKKDSGV